MIYTAIFEALLACLRSLLSSLFPIYSLPLHHPDPLAYTPSYAATFCVTLSLPVALRIPLPRCFILLVVPAVPLAFVVLVLTRDTTIPAL